MRSLHQGNEGRCCTATKILLAGPRRSDRTDRSILVSTRGVTVRADLEWLLEISPGGTAPAEGLNSDLLCNFIETAFDHDNSGHFEVLYVAALRWPFLWTRYSTMLEGVRLDSAGRASPAMHQQLREMQQDIPPPLFADPAKQVVARLEQFEAGQAEAWWRLDMDLTLTPTSRGPGPDIDCDITEMPGWKSADATVRQNPAAAERYLTVGETSVGEWLGKVPTPLFRNDIAALRAFALLKQEAPEAYDRIPAAAWQNGHQSS